MQEVFEVVLHQLLFIRGMHMYAADDKITMYTSLYLNFVGPGIDVA